MFSYEFCGMFKNTHIAKYLSTDAKEVTNIERHSDPVHQIIVFIKANIQKEIIGEKMCSEKCLFTVIRARDVSSWKAS